MTSEYTVPSNWDTEAEIVIVGFGGAGAAASITASDLGAKVIILEKAPQGRHGGNTKVAAQGYLNPDSIEGAVAYLTAMCGPYEVPEDMVQVWAEEVCQNNDWISSIGGDPQEHQFQVGIEYPELPGSESTHKFHHGDILGYSETWKFFDKAVQERPIEILYETPGKELIQNDITKEIIGVKAIRDGKPYYVKATKGVILTCGGFENNQEMIRNYLPGIPYCYTNGSPYNEGDGITMAVTVGAELWHMNNFAGPSFALKVDEYETTFSMQALHFSKETPGGMIVIGSNGGRFFDEKYKHNHGKVKKNGVWAPMPTPCPLYMIFDHTLLTSGPLYDKEPRSAWNPMVDQYDWSDSNEAELAKGWIKKADTIEDLADQINHDPAVLQDTINKWNYSCELGEDIEYERKLMLNPLVTAPFYAVALSPTMLNTQGGPRRNTNAQIIRPDGSPIPRLYSAGELGSIYSYLYQGTGNIGECFAFGRIAARNAVADSPWI
ncbi:MAG: FAD-binding protein [Dehalococcoidia bacterium]|nr:FAD-binding protein [Dehalococcoidia bacterium]